MINSTRSYSFLKNLGSSYLSIILFTRHVILHNNRHHPGPSCLHPVDIAGRNIAGIVMSLGELGIQIFPRIYAGGDNA